MPGDGRVASIRSDGSCTIYSASFMLFNLYLQNAAGDVATQGVAPKARVRRNGRFYLFKNGEERNVESELPASRIWTVSKSTM